MSTFSFRDLRTDATNGSIHAHNSILPRRLLGEDSSVTNAILSINWLKINGISRKLDGWNITL